MSKEDELFSAEKGPGIRSRRGGHILRFRGRAIEWCDLCEVFIISCDKCQGTNCNCMACDHCRKDQQDINALGVAPEQFMSEAERRIVEKYKSIKRHLPECLAKEHGFTVAEIDAAGWMAPFELELFQPARPTPSSHTEEMK